MVGELTTLLLVMFALFKLIQELHVNPEWFGVLQAILKLLKLIWQRHVNPDIPTIPTIPTTEATTSGHYHRSPMEMMGVWISRLQAIFELLQLIRELRANPRWIKLLEAILKFLLLIWECYFTPDTPNV